MADNSQNPVSSTFGAICADLDGLKADMRDVKVRLTSVEEGLAGSIKPVDRIEKRLDLVGA